MLEVREVSAGYGDAQVLFGPSLRVAQGEIVALLGSNGAGKSTLIRCITGLLRPRGGAIAFEGRPIAALTGHQVVDLGIACVPEGRQVFHQMSILENLLLGSYLRRTRQDRARNLEHVFGLFPRLEERAGQAAGTLSGGEQQMLAIARALMSGPRLLIVDELSLGLAPLVVKGLFRTLADIRRQGVTILLVEQNVQQSLRMSDRAYVLESGRIVLEGRSGDLLQNAEVKKAYLAL